MFRVPYPVVAAYPSDDPTDYRSSLMLYENGLPLGPAHSNFSDVARHGFGLFSHFERQGVVFATSDNSNPNSNGRQYAMTVAEAGVVLPPAMKLRYPWPITAGRYSVAIRASVLTAGASGELAVSFDDQPGSALSIVGSEDRAYRVPLAVEASHGVVLELTNTSGALLWIDYAELEPS
jgi:hypothetical protein